MAWIASARERKRMLIRGVRFLASLCLSQRFGIAEGVFKYIGRIPECPLIMRQRIRVSKLQGKYFGSYKPILSALSRRTIGRLEGLFEQRASLFEAALFLQVCQ